MANKMLLITVKTTKNNNPLHAMLLSHANVLSASAFVFPSSVFLIRSSNESIKLYSMALLKLLPAPARA